MSNFIHGLLHRFCCLTSLRLDRNLTSRCSQHRKKVNTLRFRPVPHLTSFRSPLRLHPLGAVQLPQHRRFEVQPLAAFARGDPLGRQAQGGAAASEAEVVPVGHLRRGALWGFSGMKGKKT